MIDHKNTYYQRLWSQKKNNHLFTTLLLSPWYKTVTASCSLFTNPHIFKLFKIGFLSRIDIDTELQLDSSAIRTILFINENISFSRKTNTS